MVKELFYPDYQKADEINLLITASEFEPIETLLPL
jgi:hypothetical protein